MKKLIDLKLFFLLLVLSIITSFMVLPYTFALSPNLAELFTAKVIALQIVQNLVIFSLAVFVGLLLYKRVGFQMPFFKSIVEGKNQSAHLKSIFTVSVCLGAIGGILIVLLDLFFKPVTAQMAGSDTQAAVWKAFLASFYGGIGEEILMRFFLVSLFTWLTALVKKSKDGTPTKTGVWLSIILVSVIFGLGHLPVTATLIELSFPVVIRAILLNGIGGVIFGWLYWKKGLESAVIAHFTADIILHIIAPNVSKLFM